MNALLEDGNKEVARLHILIEQLKAKKDAFHSVAKDFWIYGRPAANKSAEWNATLAEFDRLELTLYTNE